MGGVGSGGHNRRSDQEHQLHGTYRYDRHGGGRRTLADACAAGELGAVGNPPRGALGPEGRKLWQQIRDALEPFGILCALDRPGLELCCEIWQHLIAAERQIASEGLTITTPRGIVKEHPAVKTAQQLRAVFLSFAKDFGLTPASRKRMATPRESVDADEDFLDPFAEYLTRQRN